MRDHPNDLPAEYRHWVEAARRWTVEEHYADLELRTEVFDAVQRVLGHYDLLLCPDPVLHGRPEPRRRRHERPGRGRRRARRPADRLVPDLPLQLHRPPGCLAVRVRRARLPVGLQLVGRRWADADVIAASATLSGCGRGREAIGCRRAGRFRLKSTLCSGSASAIPGSGSICCSWQRRRRGQLLFGWVRH